MECRPRDCIIFFILFLLILVILVCLNGSIAADELVPVVSVILAIGLLYLLILYFVLRDGYQALGGVLIILPPVVATLYLVYTGLNSIAADS